MEKTEPKFEKGETVYFSDDPEPGVVQKIEDHACGNRYLVSFEDMPGGWPGYWYLEAALTSTQPGSSS